MAAIIGSGIALSTVIIDTSHQAQTLDNFIAASLAADSGIERGLAVIKVGRASSTQDDTQVAAGGENHGASGILMDVSGNGAEMTTVTAKNSGAGDSFSYPKLIPKQSVTFDIFPPSGTPPNTLDVSAQPLYWPSSSNLSAGNGGLIVSWVALDTSGQPVYTGQQTLSLWDNPDVESGETVGTLHTLEVSLNSGISIRTITGGQVPDSTILNNVFGYRIRITATDVQANSGLAAIDNFTVTNISVTSAIKDLSGNVLNPSAGFPSHIIITSKGNVGTSQSLKSVSVPWQLPSSALFNYVLFTEGSITPAS